MATRRGVGLEFAFLDPVDDGGLGNVTIPGNLAACPVVKVSILDISGFLPSRRCIVARYTERILIL